MASPADWIRSVTPQDKPFYQALGKRIAEQRKVQGLTQVELAEWLGVSQQRLAHYEVGRLRVAVAMPPTLAKELAVSVETLIGVRTPRHKRGPAPKLQRQIEEIQKLPRTRQRFVMQMLDTVPQQGG